MVSRRSSRRFLVGVITETAGSGVMLPRVSCTRILRGKELSLSKTEADPALTGSRSRARRKQSRSPQSDSSDLLRTSERDLPVRIFPIAPVQSSLRDPQKSFVLEPEPAKSAFLRGQAREKSLQAPADRP